MRGLLLLVAMALCVFAGAATSYAADAVQEGGGVGGSPSPASGEALSAAELVAEARERDGERIRIAGEAIGDVMSAEPGRVWVNVLSGGTAMGLWMSAAEAEAVVRLGDYDESGTILEAVGIFNFACDQHHGDPDVHVESVRVVGVGGTREQLVHWWKLGLGGGLASMAAIFALLYRRDVMRVG